MVALVFEVYGAICFFSLIAFLVWAAVAKLRPDLDEEEFDLAELEKLKRLVSLSGLATLSRSSPRSSKSHPGRRRPVR